MPITELLRHDQRANWVRLRTLVVLRWFAITGQCVAIFVALVWFDLDFAWPAAVAVVAVAVAANAASLAFYPRNRRLTEREVSLWLAFDMAQLAALLFLTGGLTNPNALLLLAPVTIAATALRTRTTVLLGALAIAMIGALSLWHLPIAAPDGQELRLPRLLVLGTATSLITGVIFLSIYARLVTREIHAMSDALVATQMALAREQKLTDLGGVVAAAAHELGTPLATIKLVAAELLTEVQGAEARQDIALIGEQADRCRDILRSMGQTGKDDRHMRRAPLEAVVMAAAEPHLRRGKTIRFDAHGGTDDSRQPVIFRQPEILHGLRNLIQNAVDFSAAAVEIDITWSQTAARVEIADDGAGFPASVIGRIGDPFMRRRRAGQDADKRPGYDGMGLGLFIAKTLLERTGATVLFANGGPDGRLAGAIVAVEWHRSEIEATGVLGENQPVGEP